MTIDVEIAARQIYRLSRKGHAPAEIMRRLPKLTYEISGDQLAQAFRQSAEMHEAEAERLRRIVAERRAKRALI